MTPTRASTGRSTGSAPRQGGAAKRPLDWGQAEALEKVEAALKRREPDGVRRWYVNGEGHTMVLVPGPVEFVMGAPPDEPEHFDNEVQHRVRIGRSFAIGAKLVTVAQFERFLAERPDVWRAPKKEVAHRRAAR